VAESKFEAIHSIEWHERQITLTGEFCIASLIAPAESTKEKSLCRGSIGRVVGGRAKDLNVSRVVSRVECSPNCLQLVPRFSHDLYEKPRIASEFSENPQGLSS